MRGNSARRGPEDRPRQPRVRRLRGGVRAARGLRGGADGGGARPGARVEGAAGAGARRRLGHGARPRRVRRPGHRARPPPRVRPGRRRARRLRRQLAAPRHAAVVTPDTDPLHQLMWLAARSAGLVAWALAALATILGLAMAARRVDRGPQVRELHNHLTLAALIALAGHGVAIALDPWLKGGVVGVLVPFTTGYRPLAVATGILGGWLLAAFAGSWYLRRSIGAGTWRRLHRFAPGVLVASTPPALTPGSDAGTGGVTPPRSPRAARPPPRPP